MEQTVLRTVALPAGAAPGPRPVQEYLHLWADLWWNDQADPDLGPAYSVPDQQEAEAQLQRLLAVVGAELQSPPRSEAERLTAQARLLAAFSVLGSTLGIERRSLEAVVSCGFVEAATEFIRMARRFDPAVSADDIFQASRNVWTMNLLQLALGRPVRVTPSVFAYSMLYPYSDNYIDDPSISHEVKLAFNSRFRHRLMGQEVAPGNAQERAIYDLVAMIEGEFERPLYPQVYESLLAIHAAQARSMALLNRAASPYEVDILGITFEKGGASVLADGYLVAGQLADAQAELLFGYGAFTQLMDDLEDVEQDLRNGLRTVFSQTAGRWPLDGVTRRTFRLGARVVEGLAAFDTPGLEPLKGLMRRSINPLLLGTAGQAGRLYSRAYLREMESHSPFRFSTLRRMRDKLRRQRVSLAGLVEAVASGSL